MRCGNSLIGYGNFPAWRRTIPCSGPPTSLFTFLETGRTAMQVSVPNIENPTEPGAGSKKFPAAGNSPLHLFHHLRVGEQCEQRRAANHISEQDRDREMRQHRAEPDIAVQQQHKGLEAADHNM